MLPSVMAAAFLSMPRAIFSENIFASIYFSLFVDGAPSWREIWIAKIINIYNFTLFMFFVYLFQVFYKNRSRSVILFV